MNALSDAEALFEKQEIVGKGAYGAVYRGINKQNGEIVALKVIDLDHPDNEDIDEIQREVALLSQLRDAANHNITLYHGCWITGMELWIAMDFASGGSIRTLMKAGPIEERLTVIIMREVLIALAYLHKENIIHRDIKAANILLTQAGKILLCDFGVAAHLSTSSKRSTFIGTPYWMAPEVISEGKLYDTKADLWSLGVTVYEIANGNPPFARMEPLRAIAMIPRTEPAKLEGDQWTAAMKEFMALCMTPEPSLRPTAEELSKSRWIKSASRMPTALLRELIVRYGGWVNAGGVRMSIIGDIARRDDTFELDMDRPSSWLFDAEEDLQLGGLGDEPSYAGQNFGKGDVDEVPTARKQAPTSQANHPLMNLFRNGESGGGANDSSGYGGSLTSSTSTNWANGDTLRPNSIAIPDLGEENSAGISLPSFDDNSAFAAWAPATTSWTVPSAMSVGNIEREEELVELDENGDARYIESGDESNGSISLPSDLVSPTTVRPSWASNAQPAFSLFGGANPFNPNPFPKQRNRQASNDTLYGPTGGIAGPAFSGSPPQEHEERFARSDSPESFFTGTSRSTVAQSPSLPTLSKSKQVDEGDMVTSRAAISPASSSLASLASARMRSNTAPEFDHGQTPLPPTPTSAQSKNVLNFSKASPFTQDRAPLPRRPSALNIPDANAVKASGPLTPRHGMTLSEDNLLTPMPHVSPTSAVQTPTTSGFPFPNSSSSPQFSVAGRSLTTPLSASTSIGYGSAAWPQGPQILPFDYAAMSRGDNVQAELESVIGQLGQWLTTIDQGMSHMLAECA